jgi:hypothetical protein
LVLSCKDGLRELSAELEQQIGKILSTIIPPRNAKVRDALTNAGLLALPFLRRPSRSKVKRTILQDFYCAVALIKMQTPEAYRLLPEYFIDDRPSYVDKMLFTISNIESDLAEQAQLAQLIKKVGVTDVNWELLKSLAFICQDAELSLSSFNKAQEGNEGQLYIDSIERWEINRGLKPFASLTH